MGISLTGLNSGVADTYSSLLGGAGSNGSDLAASSLLSDYASIKNGSYGKLMKSYYAKATEEEESASSSKKAEKKKDEVSASSASTAYKSAEKLSNMEITSENKEEVYDALSAFVKDYNSMIKNAGKSEIASVKKQADSLNDAMYTNFELFAKVGITLNEDRTLSINKDNFMKGDNVSTIKALFSGIGSFADKVATKASQIYRYASDGKAMTAKSYTSNGTYNTTNTADSTIDSTT